MTPCLSQPIIGTSVEVPVIVYQAWINTHNSLRMDRWMTCDLTSFITIFQSYQGGVLDDNERLCARELRLWLRRFHLE